MSHKQYASYKKNANYYHNPTPYMGTLPQLPQRPCPRPTTMYNPNMDVTALPLNFDAYNNMNYNQVPVNQNNMMNKVQYYVTGIYPTPHNTNAVPMSPEYQDLLSQISSLYTDYGRPLASEQEQLMFEIQLLTTSVVNYQLYLDVFPTDQEAIRLFNEYRNQLMLLTNEYEERYGAITLDSETLDKYPWNWLQAPWPWEA